MRTLEDFIADVDLVIAACSVDEIRHRTADGRRVLDEDTYDGLVWRIARFAVGWGISPRSFVMRDNRPDILLGKLKEFDNENP